MEYIRNFQAAERNAAAVLRRFGFHDAVTTPPGADGGVDVVSQRAIAQVKWRGAAAGRPELQKLYGARGARIERDLFFFSAAGFSRAAVEYADDNGIHLFEYDPLGQVQPRSARAHRIVRLMESPGRPPAPSWESVIRDDLKATAPIRLKNPISGKQAFNSIVLGLLFGLGGFLALGAAIAGGQVVWGVLAGLFVLACAAAVVGGFLMLGDRKR